MKHRPRGEGLKNLHTGDRMSSWCAVCGRALRYDEKAGYHVARYGARWQADAHNCLQDARARAAK